MVFCIHEYASMTAKSTTPPRKTGLALLREVVSSLVLLALIAASWVLLSGRTLDVTQTTFVYKDF